MAKQTDMHTPSTRSAGGTRAGDNFGSDRTAVGTSARRAAGDAASQLGDAAQDAGRQARQTASSLASQASDRVLSLADRQVDAGADLVAEVAESVRAAATRLDKSMPQLSHFGHSAADMVEEFSETMRDQSAADLLQATSDFARRRPAVLFGATAAIGFVLFRVLTASAPRNDRGYDDWDDFDRDDWEPQTQGTRATSARNAGVGPIGGSNSAAGVGSAASSRGQTYVE